MLVDQILTPYRDGKLVDWLILDPGIEQAITVLTKKIVRFPEKPVVVIIVDVEDEPTHRRAERIVEPRTQGNFRRLRRIVSGRVHRLQRQRPVGRAEVLQPA